MIPAIVAIASAWLLGILGIAALWPRDRSLSGDAWLILPLGIGAGLGATSALFFAASLVSSEPLRISPALELLTAAGLAGCLWWRRRTARSAAQPAPSGSWATVIMGSIFAQACIVSMVAAVRSYQAEPYSNSDGWTIWLMHARRIYRGSAEWASLLHAPQIAWTHPDYPLLVPASVARAWAHAGQDAPFVSGIISTMFGVATVGLLVAAVARLRHRVAAFAGGLVLLGTPFFVTFSSNQHADIPLGFFILATLVLIAFGSGEPRGWGLSALAGAMAGMAAWTKNEGILFIVAVAAAWGIHESAHRRWRALGAFAGGLLVALVPVVYFKIMLAPANDIVASDPWSRLQDLLDGSRHRLILASIRRDVWRFGEWSWVPFLAMLPPLLGGGWRRITSHQGLVGAVIVLMMTGYYIVYLLTHWDLASHLDSSLVRLLLQLWPAAIFFWCLAATFDAPIPGSTAGSFILRRRGALAGVLLANAAVTGVVLAAFSRQVAPNQLAAAQINGANVRVLMGEGWFGRETHRTDVWAWSKGESTLLLRSDARQPRSVRLRFSMRSLGTRTVTASVGERVVWRGVVREEADNVEIAGLLLEPGTTPIVFHDDTPGVPESAAPDARALTFALYNPQID